MLLLRAVEAPASDALEEPVSGLRQTNQRTTGVALAGIFPALRVPGAEHVAGDLVVVPILLVTQVGADHRYVDLIQQHLITGTCKRYKIISHIG